MSFSSGRRRRTRGLQERDPATPHHQWRCAHVRRRLRQPGESPTATPNRAGEVRMSPSPGTTSAVGRLRPLCPRSSTPNLGPHEEGTGGRPRQRTNGQRTNGTRRKPKYSEPRSPICSVRASTVASPSPPPRKPYSGPTERSGPSRIAAPSSANGCLAEYVAVRTSGGLRHQLWTGRSEPAPKHRTRSATASPRHDDVGR